VQALELLDRDWPLIQRLADLLLQADRLDYSEVEAMMGAPD
jgi:hypothetical protein